METQPQPAARPTVCLYASASACGLLGGRKTKKLFGRRIWRATDECLAADDATDADGDGGGGEGTANDRGREGRGERESARTAGGDMSRHGWVPREGVGMSLGHE